MRKPPSPDDATMGASRGSGFPEGPTYFDRPMLKAPHWEWNVVTYLFLGGVMGGLGVIASLAGSGRESTRRLRRTARIASFALAIVNPPLLISHLGRPERFLHMLRIVKFKSPMSMGVWGLVFYSGAAGANVVRELAVAGVLPRWMKHVAPSILTPVQAMLASFISGYTGVLLSATANPFWASGKRHIPAFSVCSGMAGACATASLLSLFEGNHEVLPRLERLEMIAGAAELWILGDFRKRAGYYGKPMFEGRCGERLRRYTIVSGILAPMVLNVLGTLIRLPRPVEALRTMVASSLTLVGAYVLRESLIDAGKLSAADPQAAFRQPR